jgi:hypothetical protein
MDSSEPWWLGLFASVGGWLILASVGVAVGSLLVILSLHRRNQD